MPSQPTPKRLATGLLASVLGAELADLWLVYTVERSASRKPTAVVVASNPAQAAMLARERLHERGLDWTAAVDVRPLSACSSDDVSLALLEDKKHRDEHGDADK